MRRFFESIKYDLIKIVSSIETLFLLPVLILFTDISYVERSHRNPYERYDQTKISHYVMSFGTWIALILLAIIWFAYQNQFTQITYVYACRGDSDVCYRLQADYVSGFCEDDSGHCFSSYIEKIHFNNGGYISFGRNDCDTKKKDEWICTDKDGDNWNMQMAEQVKVKK